MKYCIFIRTFDGHTRDMEVSTQRAYEYYKREYSNPSVKIMTIFPVSGWVSSFYKSGIAEIEFSIKK